ncbi:Stk1 family PASTA domain-containing Ser/Thr kinase [Corynebacterium cystitidis]|uniref:non-specific serine/threonine protein kinase n=1 Tax=Corynebacterium cystitidis DSM 20524 TaxID=1121357 RepID=A0A1H9NNQ4_9CORY|nr:Stk1 family PASTA domain-containing Ser/Thr kinase [Corynebacterium cystitidis]WJY82794.1 Serine/threonine-protein kinase PknL [Corynebacterium cystitidis DSM 20524]SER37532.1 serine/threonine protein kinase [Corynebacterium cystitidis DSM 20524]SNV70438.1 serine/threonine-protein kinase [Corynebacterium cystitidis]
MKQLAVGDYLEDRYRIDHPIARGGMSTVYRCVDERLGREVAAKVMDDRYVDDAVFLDRFRREARAMAQLTHPNLVNVYDFSVHGDHAFLIMELITGGTLRELLAERGPMPPHAATAVMRAVLTGLSVAHAKGMVHRDIKPDNILINSDNRVKLADFGLVRAASDAKHSTDQIVGTVAYLSPEQVDGNEITQASDVYSSGIVLFELLTGTTPFSGDTQLAHAFARINEDVPPPSSRIEGVPKLFDELVATATAREPHARFRDAGDFLAALDDVAAELNLPAYTVPVPTESAAHRAAAVPTNMGPGDARDNDPSVDDTAHDAGATSVIHAQLPEPYNETRVQPVVPPPAPAPQPAAPPPAHASGHEPAVQRNVEPPAPESNRSSMSLLVWLIIIGVLTAAVAIGAWWFGSGRYGEIPQVLGMDRDQAVTAVSEAGFEPATEIVYHNDVPKDQPVGTDPPGGNKALPGEEVTVLISQGKPTVPEVPAGMGVEDYRALADQRTFEVTTGESVYSSDAPVGSIAVTDPPAGTPLSIGSTITVSVSKGPEPIAVPDIRGLPEADAIAALENAGLNVGEISETFDDEIYGGNVVSTDPAKATELERGDTVDLVISNARTIPDVSGKTIDDATDALEEKGITVDRTTRSSDQVSDTAHRVLSTDPPAWTNLEPNSAEVVLILPGQVTVPNFVGMRVEDARALADEVGLKINRGSRYNDEVITKQRTQASDAVRPGSTVRVESE